MSYAQDPQVRTMIDNLPERTGRPLEDWFKVIQSQQLEKHGEIMNLLKGQHGVSHGFANTIALLYRESLQGGPASEDDLVTSQYIGRENLKPLYDRIIYLTNQFGQDVTIAPKKAYVSLRRARQFAIVQPTTKARMDLGLNMKGQKSEGLLIEGDRWSGMCTHRIELEKMDDLNDEVIAWLRKAYEQAG